MFDGIMNINMLKYKWWVYIEQRHLTIREKGQDEFGLPSRIMLFNIMDKHPFQILECSLTESGVLQKINNIF